MGNVMLARTQPLNRIIDLMREKGLGEDDAVKRIVDLGIQDYVAGLYQSGEISIREAADIMHLSYRETLDLLEKKVGGNVAPEQEARALMLAKRLADESA